MVFISPWLFLSKNSLTELWSHTCFLNEDENFSADNLVNFSTHSALA